MVASTKANTNKAKKEKDAKAKAKTAAGRKSNKTGDGASGKAKSNRQS